jgi:hypothetical protein
MFCSKCSKPCGFSDQSALLLAEGNYLCEKEAAPILHKIELKRTTEEEIEARYYEEQVNPEHLVKTGTARNINMPRSSIHIVDRKKKRG